MDTIFKFSISNEASFEYDSAAAWYENQSAGLGLRFIESVEKK